MWVFRSELPALMNLGIESEAAVLIASSTKGNPGADVILQLDGRVLRLGYVRGEGNE